MSNFCQSINYRLSESIPWNIITLDYRAKLHYQPFRHIFANRAFFYKGSNYRNLDLRVIL